MSALLDYYAACRAAIGTRGDGSAQSCHIGPAGVEPAFGDARLRNALWGPLAHLAGDGAARVLSVRVVDDRSVGCDRPPLPWARQEGPADAVDRCVGGSVEAVVEGVPGLLSMMHLEKGEALLWAPAAERCEVYQRAAPLRAIIQWWLSRNGLQMVHGAAVGRPDGAVLLVGPGGSGKSTTALACLDSDLRYAGDDYVAVDGERVYSVYGSAKATPRTLELLPFLRDGVENRHELAFEKGIVNVARQFREAPIREMPLRAVVMPCVTDRQRPTFERLGSARALAALAPSTLFQQRSTSPGALRTMSALVRRVPCYRLAVGPDMAAIPACIDRLLDDAAACFTTARE